jgi:fructan beta-fructosidase
MTKYIFICIFLMFHFYSKAQLKTYAEMYRPQFHPSPSSGFMGDPNGPIKFKGKYHLFWWGHLRSDDLVYWEEINKNALNGTPSGFGNWSGSVAVDLNNTSGFGMDGIVPMVAAYTLHENSTGIQRQAISYSLNYGSFNYYTGNPVINSTSHDFRDPQVFWHPETAKWIMVVAKPVDRAIEIYSSADLKSWSFESSFSDRGAKKEVWEVPDLFELPLNGDVQNKKWIMTCGMGPNRMQYWVGNFDGHQFILDSAENLLMGAHVPGYVFEDFENSFDGWTIEGDAFGTTPVNGSLPNQQTVNGYTGNGYASSYHSGDASTGKMISKSFIVTNRFVNFLMGGGSGTGTKLSVIADGQEIASATAPANLETLRWMGIDVSGAIGKTAHIEIVDAATAGWGHTLIDHIVFSNTLFDTRVENANWADWGFDFYAAKSFRNYDNDDSRKIWLAWMGNWTYAKDVPTRPWQGFESVPRELRLIKQDHGYQLAQIPIQELEKLRLAEISKQDFTVSGSQSFGFEPEWNVYELKVKFKVKNESQVFGLNMAETNGQKIVVSFDAKTSVLSVTRPVTHFSYANARVSKAPIVLSQDSVLDLHIFLDQSSIEVFANNYNTSISSLAFTRVNETGISLFSNVGSVDVVELKAWPLKSIWGIMPAEVERPTTITSTEANQESLSLFPNPVKRGGELNLKMQVKPDSICLFDAQGSLHWHPETTDLTFKIPETFKTGLYFLRIQSVGRTQTMKIIVE